MNRRILKLALPSILANITVPLVGMVDIAVVGRLGSSTAIAAIAIGTMLFDLLYWNFGFLRVGTGGLTAQAYGRRSFKDAMKYLTQGLSTSLSAALLLFAIQYLFVWIAFMLVDASPEAEALAREYFFIRIWAAPATLSLFVFKGWFIGMQNTVSSMTVDLSVNIINLVMSVLLCLYTPLGFSGVAWGTLIAQYSGILIACFIMWRYYRKLFRYVCFRDAFHMKDIMRFFRLNGDLFIRSLGFMLIYSGFTTLAAKYGDTPLAVCSIIMKLLMLYSFFLDGFAYAAEALTGKYIGARDRNSLTTAVRYIFVWCFGIGVVSTFIYGIWGFDMVKLMTNSAEVLDASGPYLPWLAVMPLVSCVAFTWDGVYIGATSSVPMRNCMLMAALFFYILYYMLEPFVGIQALWIAYFSHLAVRAVYLSVKSGKYVFRLADADVPVSGTIANDKKE